MIGRKPQARRPSRDGASSISIRRAVSEFDRLCARAVEKMRQVGRDGDDGLRTLPDEAKSPGDLTRLGVADENRENLERLRQHRLQHDEMHFERMFARERPRVDRSRLGFRQAEMKIAGDVGLAERRAPGHGGMKRDPAKSEPVRGADDHDSARRIGPPRPWAEGGRGDRAGIDNAGMRRDDDFGRDAAVGPGALQDVADQIAKARRVGRIEKPGNLRGMDVLPRMDLHLAWRLRHPCLNPSILAASARLRQIVALPDRRIAGGARPT